MLCPHSLHDIDALSCSGGEADQQGKVRPLSCRSDEDIILLTHIQHIVKSDVSSSVTTMEGQDCSNSIGSCAI